MCTLYAVKAASCCLPPRNTLIYPTVILSMVRSCSALHITTSLVSQIKTPLASSLQYWSQRCSRFWQSCGTLLKCHENRKLIVWPPLLYCPTLLTHWLTGWSLTHSLTHSFTHSLISLSPLTYTDHTHIAHSTNSLHSVNTLCRGLTQTQSLSVLTHSHSSESHCNHLLTLTHSIHSLTTHSALQSMSHTHSRHCVCTLHGGLTLSPTISTYELTHTLFTLLFSIPEPFWYTFDQYEAEPIVHGQTSASVAQHSYWGWNISLRHCSSEWDALIHTVRLNSLTHFLSLLAT